METQGGSVWGLLLFLIVVGGFALWRSGAWCGVRDWIAKQRKQ